MAAGPNPKGRSECMDLFQMFSGRGHGSSGAASDSEYNTIGKPVDEEYQYTMLFTLWILSAHLGLLV